MTALAASPLLSLGYSHFGIDDGWQLCNSYQVQPSNTPAFHDVSGTPIVNASKFSDLKGMVAYGARKGLKVGFYMNNCMCHESGGRISNQTWRSLSYAGDVRQLVDAGFQGACHDSMAILRWQLTYIRLQVSRLTTAGCTTTWITTLPS